MNKLWTPSCDLETWKARMDLIAQIRSFFIERQVLEVETPSLSFAIGTDPHLDYLSSSDQGRELYLMTSPEFHMKRLLAAGFGDIWQLCKAFRAGESGDRHNVEFTILEWYRINFDWNELMAEVIELCCCLPSLNPLLKQPWSTITWQQAYEQFAQIDALNSTENDFLVACERLHLAPLPAQTPIETWLDYFMVSVLEPQLGKSGPQFLTHYPAAQAALAQLDTNPRWARRFELYIDGIELCNGYQELSDYEEQKFRFENDLKIRGELGKSKPKIDTHFLEALKHGMPPCSGVALGIDRLVMIALNKKNLNEVLLFPIDRA